MALRKPKKATEIGGATPPPVTVASRTEDHEEPAVADQTRLSASPHDDRSGILDALSLPLKDSTEERNRASNSEVEGPLGAAAAPPDEAVSNSRGPRDDTGAEDRSQPALPMVPAIETLIIGEETTFNKAAWWSEKNWTRLNDAGYPGDISSQIGTTGSVALLGASLRGRKHRLAGQPNQDAFATLTLERDDNATHLIAAVCDGMGSAQHSAHGARAAALVAPRLIASCLKTWADGDIEQLRIGLETEPASFLKDLTEAVVAVVNPPLPQWLQEVNLSPPANTEISEMQTTLTCAVLDLRHGDDIPGLLITVGDSPAFKLEGEGPTPLETPSDHTGLWTSSTDGLLGATGWSITEVQVGRDSPLLLCSDGLGNFLSHGTEATTLGRYITHQWRTPIRQIDFVRDLAFDLASADDDRTAVVIWNRS